MTLVEQICKDAFTGCQLSFIAIGLLVAFGIWNVYLMFRINQLERQLHNQNELFERGFLEYVNNLNQKKDDSKEIIEEY